MAQFVPRLFWLVAAGLAVNLRVSQAGVSVVRLNNQGGPIFEGSNVTLECLTDEEGEDLSGFTFQKYGKWLHSWISLDTASELRCWFYSVAVSRDDGRLLLTINDLKSWHAGSYRCIASNATGNASFSDELDLQMEYLHGIFLARTNTWCATVGDSVTVLEGSDLQLRCTADASQTPLYEWTREGDDWVVVSSDLTFAKVNREQAGTYTCHAQHPTLPQLSKSKSVRLFVEGSERGFTLESVLSLSTPVLALAVALPAVLLLLVIMVFAFLIPRRRAAAKKKAAQEDSGQRTPIYKGSLESVPSAVGDTHPLVM
ncbi:carcinoembryonic antigen-related cell adhesion molecule 20-like [Rhineura floridana]|uniref:carcinoembryonic antigen-related cell adhesion molecule 20-like n=1 Tax=Rhineura floridana TaxID=261503 RepID=UPI002AC7E6AA|nr:carcinoembryonic antigen-related cell adhesion molecule 20-like [Rhineura floridana]XP_061454058.1 carcinoembryonic antigen-related cell adhesion molecule 20-like [Rhineura floridana]